MPEHPLLRETRREVLHDLLNVPAAVRWLSRGRPDTTQADDLSPFAAAWISPSADEPVQFESPADGLRRLHARLTASGKERSHEAAKLRRGHDDLPVVGGWQLTPEGGLISARRARCRDRRCSPWLRVGPRRGGDCVPAHSLAETLQKLDGCWRVQMLIA